MDSSEWENNNYDPDDVGPRSPQLQPMRIHLLASRSPSPDIYEDGHDNLVFDDSCEGLMSDLYPQLPRCVPDYPPPNDSDPYRWYSQMDLPLTVCGTAVPARPDSGCEENIMSASLASQFGLPVSRKKEDRKTFRVANGKTVEAIGRVSIWSCFPEEPWKEMRLNFYLFPQAISPLIMGMSFLAETKVLNENRYRLQPRQVKRRGPYQVSLLNNPKTRLNCLAQSVSARGNPDTGSEIDLMSLSYVTKRGFELKKIEDEETEVQFADGSSSTLAGKVIISLVVCSDSRLEGEMTFYVLEDLTCDILFGEEFLHVNEIFQKHQTALGTSDADGFSEANAILWKNKGEKLLSRLFSGRERRASSLIGETSNDFIQSWRDDARELHRRELTLEAIHGMEGSDRENALDLETKRAAAYDRNRDPLFSDLPKSKGRDTSSDTEDSTPSGMAIDRMSIDGATNNHGESSADTEGSTPPGMAIDRMVIDGIASPQIGGSTPETPSTDSDGATPPAMAIDRMTIDGITNPQIGGFQCTYPGCPAQPFQTQYLLNSHANIHSSNRPHYCSVKGCPRAEGGKGFKRKNEMIRHGLVHDSPGYVCPFCPDREHKYPRPDNLERHVRVHHVDKDKDDPTLREVLSQGPEGPSRGRGRRGGTS